MTVFSMLTEVPRLWTVCHSYDSTNDAWKLNILHITTPYQFRNDNKGDYQALTVAES